MATNAIVEELIRLRNEWLENAHHLERTIELLKANGSLNGSSLNGESKTKLSISNGTGGFLGSAFISKKGAIPNFKSMGVDEKIVAIMRHENRFLFRTEIEDIAKAMGQGFKRMIASSLSGIKRTKTELQVVSFKIEHNVVVWGFQEWLDDQGNILPDHIYIPKNEEVTA